MAGIATTVVEAMHLGRHGIGVEYEARWAALAAEGIHLAERQGAAGTGEIIHGDSRHLPALIPPQLHGRIALVITSPPYGPSTHGHVRTPGPRRGKVRKIHHKYGADTANLAYRDHDELAAGFTQILTGAAAILRPGGIVAITARPYRRHGELVDIPGMVVAAGTNAGLRLQEECAALIAGIRDGRLISRASFFQQKNVRAAIADGDPQWLLQHEDVLVFVAHSGQRPRPAITQADHGLDVSSPSRMDRRPQPAHPAITHPSGSAADPRSRPARESERTPDPCPPHQRPAPKSIPPNTAGHRWHANHDAPCPQGASSDTAVRR
jgi:hypothetical protein